MTFLMPVLKKEWNLGEVEEASIASVVFVGMLLGSFIFGIISDVIGRKKASLITVTAILLGSILSIIAPSLYWMVFFRGIVGFGVGLCSNSKKKSFFLILSLTFLLKKEVHTLLIHFLESFSPPQQGEAF